MGGDMSTISASTTTTTAYVVTADTTGTLVLQTGASPTTALTLSSGQVMTLPNDASISGLTVGKGGGAVATATVVGNLAGNSNVSGGYLTAVGYGAGRYVTSDGVTAIGYSALNSNSTGVNNTALGAFALTQATTASYNAAVGYQSGFYTTGAANTFLGTFAGYGDATGSGNTWIGYAAGPNTTTTASGTQNVAVGRQALYSNTTASNNTAVGYQAANSNTTGTITAVGALAGYANTTGTENTVVGNTGLRYNTTGNGGSALGTFALYANTTGSSNTAVGRSALESNTTASNNTAVGYQAGYTNTTGPQNTFIGHQSGYNTNNATGYNTFVGRTSGYSNTTGYQNTFFGGDAGYYVTTGNKNTILGMYNGNQGSLDIRTSSNNIVLSDGDGNPRAYWDSANNRWTFGTSSIMNLGGTSQATVFRSGADGSGIHFSTDSGLPANQNGTVSDNTESWGAGGYRWTVIYATTGTINTSDRQQKQDIQDLSAAELAAAQEIKTLFKTFRWKDAVIQKGEDARIHVGVIAQDVQAAFARQGLDASRYALWCSDTWYEVDGAGINDATGTRYTAESEGAVEKTRLGIRYDQLLAFVIAAM